jgi:AcrR family transcriptional regulator
LKQEEEPMGTAERREREKERRRGEILDAAEKVFFSKGVRDATMDEIAGVAELSKGTLYLYFKSKEEIYFGINRRALGILHGMFEVAVAPQPTGLERVRAIGEAYYRFSQDYPYHFEAMMHFDAEVTEPKEAGSLALECHEAGMGLLQMVADAIKIGIDDGSIRRDLDPMKTAILLWAQTDGVIRVVARKCEHLEAFAHRDLKGLMNDFMMFVYNALKPIGNGDQHPGQSYETWRGERRYGWPGQSDETPGDER